jgi:hypothetical protein
MTTPTSAPDRLMTRGSRRGHRKGTQAVRDPRHRIFGRHCSSKRPSLSQYSPSPWCAPFDAAYQDGRCRRPWLVQRLVLDGRRSNERVGASTGHCSTLDPVRTKRVSCRLTVGSRCRGRKRSLSPTSMSLWSLVRRLACSSLNDEMATSLRVECGKPSSTASAFSPASATASWGRRRLMTVVRQKSARRETDSEARVDAVQASLLTLWGAKTRSALQIRGFQDLWSRRANRRRGRSPLIASAIGAYV